MGVAVVVSPYTGAKDIVREGVNGYTLGTVSEQAIAQIIPKAVGLSGGFDARMIPSDKDIFNRYLDVIADIRRRLGSDTGNGI
jgi:hypothetical protein